MEDRSGGSRQGPSGDRDDQAANEIPLAESELRSILSTIDDAVFIFSVDEGAEGVEFTFEWNNPAHRRITGMTIEAFRGLNPREFLGEQLGRSVVENYRTCVERRAMIEYQEQLVHERGEVMWQTKLVPVIEDDTVVQIIGLARDITDLTERTTHLQVVDRVLRHNIRNTLNHIQGRARQIATQSAAPVDAETDQILESADGLLRTAEKARRITEVILEDPPGAAIDVESLLQQASTRLDGTCDDANLSVVVKDPATLVAGPWVIDAVVELVQNAVDHHQGDAPTVEIVGTADETMVQIAVRDDGPGIPAAERDILTDGAPPSQLSHGGGLGIWMVYWIVYRSDGSVTVSDRTEGGSVVTIHLPRADPS